MPWDGMTHIMYRPYDNSLYSLGVTRYDDLSVNSSIAAETLWRYQLGYDTCTTRNTTTGSGDDHGDGSSDTNGWEAVERDEFYNTFGVNITYSINRDTLYQFGIFTDLVDIISFARDIDFDINTPISYESVDFSVNVDERCDACLALNDDEGVIYLLGGGNCFTFERRSADTFFLYI